MCSTPVLRLTDFSKSFTVKTDACKYGVEAVLMQEAQPLAFFAKAISARSMGLSTYEKKLLAVVMDMQRWRGYLLGRNFVIRTEQEALKHLSSQKITTIVQQKWHNKLPGFDYSIEYKKGRDNVVVGPLSRLTENSIYSTPISLGAVSFVKSTWKQELVNSWE